VKLAGAPDVLTVEQAAEVLSVSRGTAYEAVRTGSLPSVRIGRCIRIPRLALEHMLYPTPRNDAVHAGRE
jgi:excisionase family DNA binding protein